MSDILNEKLNSRAILNKREEVYRLFAQKSANVSSGAISSISASDLDLLFQLYDEIFLENWFKENYKGKLKFSLSRRMTRSAGLTLCPRNIDKLKEEELVLEIRIGIDFFLHYDSIEGSKTVGGIKANNSLGALQLVFEHELCHVIEFIHFKKSKCSGERFKLLAGNLFGHTESYHKLPTYRQIANQKLGLNIGDKVSFTFQGRRLSGILYNINKRATVMVQDKNGNMLDRYGVRYSKYYVPLTLIE
jgi:hypothetical protein